MVIHKAQIKLSLRNYTPDVKVCQCKATIKGMTGNIYFPNPFPSLADMESKNEELRQAIIKAGSNSYFDKAVLEEVEAEWDVMFTNLAAYVQAVANLSPLDAQSIISSAVLAPRKKRAKANKPGKIEFFKASFSYIPGTVMLHWRRPQYARMMQVYVTTEPNDLASFRLVATCQGRKFLVENLEHGKIYWFKVAGIGTAGIGDFSGLTSMYAA